jgi:predicted dehydrogenase
MKKLRVGIAGYGVVGRRRRPFIDQHPLLEVVAVADQTFAGKNKEDGLPAFKNYQELIEYGIDVLFVCLPNDVAPDATIAGLNSGLHVFCEKPPGRTVEDVERVQVAEKAHPKLKLKYGFNHRYHDSVREALSVIRSGDLGRIVNLRGIYGKSNFIPWVRSAPGAHKSSDTVHWRTSREIAGGGILLDQGIHMVDLMRTFAGDFVEIKSFVRNTFWNYEVEDNAYALMRTKDDVVAILHSTTTQWRHRFLLEITLEKGALILSGILSGSKSYGDESLTTVYRHDEDNGNPREQRMNYIRDNSWQDEIFEFGDCIQNDTPVIVGSSDEALKTMKIVFGIYGADPAWKAHMESFTK